MNTSAILVFQRSQLEDNIHPFVISEVEAFCNHYNKVILICFEYTCDDEVLRQYNNLEIIQVSLKEAKRNYKSIKWILSKSGLLDIKTAVKKRIPFMQYVKNTAQVLMFGDIFAEKASYAIANDSTTTKWVVEGYWLSGPAFAAALLKKKFPNKIISVARAHSSEIDIIRNKSAYCMMKNFVHPYLDKICFVSDWGENIYVNSIASLYRNMTLNNVITCHLGVSKLFTSTNPGSSDGIFRILSCSRVVRLKRLDLLARALCMYKGNRRIEWTHIGDGPEFDRIKNIISNQELVDFKSCGSIPNTEVQRYLSSVPTDIFINVSEFEGLPVSIIESFAYGIPCIATDAGGTGELVNESNGCLLAVKLNEQDILDKIEYFMSLPSRVFCKYRSGAYETWMSKYNKNKNYTDFFDIIDKSIL